MKKNNEKQNFRFALIWGLILMFGAAILLAVLTVLMEAQMGFFSLAIGLILKKLIACSEKK